MPLPDIQILFESSAVSAIERSGRGVVAIVLKDDTGTFDTKVLNSVADISADDWTPANKDLLEKTFIGAPGKVIVERLGETALDYADAYQRLSGKVFNYLAIPGIESADTPALASWIASQRANKKTYKAVVPNEAADDIGVINFTTEGIIVGETTYTASEYTCRIAGILAGLSLQRSATYYELPEVDDIIEAEDPDAAIDNGELILIKQDGKVKIGRGVNSLVTTTATQGDDWKKIKIIEGHDLITEDIRKTFNDEYVGKVNNSYDNQALFIAAINAYLSGLEGDVLDPNAENRVLLDVEAQRLAWESIGTDTSGMNDQEVKEKSFQSSVFIGGALKFLDAMEDLYFKVNV